MTNNPPKKQELPKPKPRTRQISPKPTKEQPVNKYAPKEKISRPGLGTLRVIDTNRPDYKP